MDDLVEALEKDLDRIENEIIKLIEAIEDKPFVNGKMVAEYLKITIRR
ncbi:hypothetical protein SERPOUNCE_19 [Bacillus phage SerPounce]|uniref:Uncharacterized protein n=1 Tax=Bacillus phage SerPounce TaxID=1983413 RepID=A0A1X9SHJ7_9CAUD|nr:hypothetical protein H3011_gp19 [Bacillus phage SerPounce]ARQ95554.1 hypothetical protein SERPOUNCE_19 [Bacillus phage SerPounce]